MNGFYYKARTELINAKFKLNALIEIIDKTELGTDPSKIDGIIESLIRARGHMQVGNFIAATSNHQEEDENKDENIFNRNKNNA